MTCHCCVRTPLSAQIAVPRKLQKGSNRSEPIKTAPQIDILREKLRIREQRLVTAKQNVEAAQERLEEHLQGLTALSARPAVKPMWMVSEVFDKEYNHSWTHCRGLFTDRKDAVLRSDLLKTRADEDEYQDGLDYYVVQLEVNPRSR